MNLPNLLTFARLAAVPLIVAMFYIDTSAARWIALMLFVAAAITDYLDGYLARLLDQHSDLGRLLDPIADKVIVAAVLVMLIGDGTIADVHLIAALIIFIRELAVAGLREFLAERQIAAPVTKLAKWKTAIQMIALALLIAATLTGPGSAIEILGLFAFWLAAALTAITGWTYFSAGLAAMGKRHAV